LKSKKHVLLCLGRFGIGGIQTFVIQLANAMAESGKYQVSIYCHVPELASTADNEEIHKDISVYTISKNEKVVIALNLIRNGFKKISEFDLKEFFIEKYFLKIVKSKKVDIIHSNFSVTDRLGLIARRKLNTPLVVTTHGVYNEYDERLLPVMKDISAYADAFVFLSERNLTVFKQQHLELENRVFIPNGYKLKNKLDVVQEKKTQLIKFGMMARGIEEKGWVQLGEAINILNHKGLDFRVKIIGDGQLPIDVFENHQSGKVEFVGKATDYEAPLIDCDVCLLPSYLKDESMPFSIITYLALGKPVIASNIGSIKWMMDYQDKTSGILLELDEKTERVNPEALAESMEEYIKNPDRIVKEQEIARGAFEKFTINNCVMSYSKLYNDILGKKG